uniref:Magnesium transporter n=1 Tax=Quercus lobata TaxID=97700 RepID=A0A7N2LC43_QUELO
MEESQPLYGPPNLPESASAHSSERFHSNGNRSRGSSITAGLKKRGHRSQSWIKIDKNGNSKTLELDKATIMRHCSLPARDLRLLDPLFIYPSTILAILGWEKAIVVSLEQIRCIITADEVILMNSLDGSVVKYKSELCKCLQPNVKFLLKVGADAMLRALELALELICMPLDAQAVILPEESGTNWSPFISDSVLEWAFAVFSLGSLLVDMVRDEIEHLLDDDGDMAEMYLTEKKQRSEAGLSDVCIQTHTSAGAREVSKSAPVSPVELSTSGSQKLQRAFSSIVSLSKHGSLISSSDAGENIEQLEMLLEAYFIVSDNTHSKLSTGNVQNQLIQFQLLLSAATFLATIYASVTAAFGMNFADSIFDRPSAFNWVLVITGGAGSI